MTSSSRYVEVSDRFGAAADDAMPFLKAALDPREVERQFRPLFISGQHAWGQTMRLRSIRVLRYKPVRRCLVEYRFADSDAPGASNSLILLGKARAKSTDRSTYHTMRALWAVGFDTGASDGIMVPEPVGMVPAFQMWLQHKLPGTVATRLLPAPGGIDLAHRIASAARKLHQSRVPTSRCHTPDDELRILRHRLTALAADRLDLSARLRWVCDACSERATELPIVVERGIHRDFYPDQVLVDRSRIALLDLDLYAAGDPALDIGNFIGHLIEQRLREPGLADQLTAAARALEQRYLAASDAGLRHSIHIYATLALARHIQISTQFRQRRHLTECLLELCEKRLRTGLSSVTTMEL